MMKCLFGTGLYGCFRGNQEHAELSLDQIEFGVFPQDFECEELRGVRYIAIKYMGNEKAHKITVTNSYVRDMENLLRFPIFENDPACFGASLERLVKKAGPKQQRVYCKEASKSEGPNGS